VVGAGLVDEAVTHRACEHLGSRDRAVHVARAEPRLSEGVRSVIRAVIIAVVVVLTLPPVIPPGRLVQRSAPPKGLVRGLVRAPRPRVATQALDAEAELVDVRPRQ